MTVRRRRVTRRVDFAQRISPILSSRKVQILEKRRIAINGEVGYIATYLNGLKVVVINKTPLTKKRAFDLLTYLMVKRNIVVGAVLRKNEPTSKRILLRELKLIPRGFFIRNKDKFIVKKIKNKIDSFGIIKK